MIEYFDYLYSLSTLHLVLLSVMAFLGLIVSRKIGDVFDLD